MPQTYPILIRLVLCFFMLLSVVGVSSQDVQAKGKKKRAKGSYPWVPYKSCVTLFRRAQRCQRHFKWYPYRAHKALLGPRAKRYKSNVTSFCLNRPRRMRLFWPGVKRCLKHRTCKPLVECFERSRISLKQPEQFGSLVCRSKRSMSLYPNGVLLHCTMDAKQAQWVNNIPLKPDAYTLFHPNGRVWQTSILPHTFRLRNKRQIACGSGSATFFADGTLASCTLDKSLKMDGVVCQKGHTTFHYQGRLSSAKLQQPKMYGSLKYPKGTWLAWNKDGKLLRGTLSYPHNMTIQGVSVHFDFRLHSNGKLAYANLHKPLKRGKRTYPSFSKLWFFPNGTIQKAVYNERTGHLPHGELWRDIRTLVFNKQGKLISSTKKHEQDVSENGYRRR